MPKKEAPLEYLDRYLPEGASGLVLDYLQRYHVHLTITRQRASVLGDYRNATRGRPHRISVNGNLNRYAFLITLIHELGHLITFNLHGNSVASHGREWKAIYSELLREFSRLQLFPEDIQATLAKSFRNPAASSCADDDLLRVLRRHDKPGHGRLLVEDLGEGKDFEIENGKVFRKGKKVRKRFQCVELATGRIYLFSPVHEVKAV
jgi:SprT protein